MVTVNTEERTVTFSMDEPVHRVIFEIFQERIKLAKRQRQTADLIGEELDAFSDVLMDVQEGRGQLDSIWQDVKELQNHRHEYGEEGFCTCGMDGNA